PVIRFPAGCACRPQGFPDLRAGRQLQRPPLVRLRSGLEICLRPCGFPVAGNTLSRPRLYPFGPPVFGYTASTARKRWRDFTPLVCCAARRTAKARWHEATGLFLPQLAGKTPRVRSTAWDDSRFRPRSRSTADTSDKAPRRVL